MTRSNEARRALAYRPEIDGLRSLAVLPVLFFHAGLPGFSGGYVGVDVFFVISGYLITSILLGELAQTRFSILRFYERRARRILPALFAVCFTCLPVACLLMTPEQLGDFGRSLAATTAFASNFHFNEAAGYFDGPGELEPLLHTWSLAIEEQFYVLFPPLLAFAYRRQRAPVLIVGTLVVSLAIAELQVGRSPDAAFYLLPARAWELMLGSALAFIEHRHGPIAGRPALALAGVFAIGLAVVLFGSATRHPSLLTLIPTGGAALVIAFARGDAAARRLLAARPFVAVGLVSYSLYLWHQPVLAFVRLASLSEPSVTVKLAALTASAALAWLSWHFVETPFRDRARWPARPVWTTAGAGSTLLLLGSIALWHSDGWPSRFDPDRLRPISEARLRANELVTEGDRECDDRIPEEACALGADADPRWALVGDSMAESISAAFRDALRQRGEAGLQLTKAGCPYLPGFERDDRKNCEAFSASVRERLSRSEIESVVVAGRYAFWLTGSRFDNGEGGVEPGLSRRMEPADFSATSDSARREAVLAGYQTAVRELLDLGKTVYLVYPIPEVGWNVPDQLFKLRVLRNDEQPVTTSSQRFAARMHAVTTALDALGSPRNLVRIRPAEWLCEAPPTGRCRTEQDGEILYSDDNHPSLAGARRVMERVASAATQSSQ